MVYRFISENLEAQYGVPKFNKDNDLCRKLGTLARTNQHIHQCVERKSSNFLTVVLEFIAVLAIMLSSIIAAWCLAVIL